MDTIKKLIALFLLILTPVVGFAEEGFVPLFNGKNFDGWVIMGNKAGWRIEDGMIRSDGGMGGRWIRTEKKYANFTLKIEWMISSVGNSGVMIRTGPYGVSPGFEVQILAPWTPHRDDLHCTGSIYGHVPVNPRPDETTGRWRAFEITCDRKKITVACDGVVCCRADMDKVSSLKGRPLSGYIGMQDSHTGKGQWVKFRNIRIKDFDRDPAYVTKGLESQDEVIRKQAFQAAGRLGSRMMDVLFRLLAGADPAAEKLIREALFTAAATASSPGMDDDRTAATAALCKHLQPRQPPEVRELAARLLRIVGREDAVAALAQALKDEAVHEAARCALQQIPGEGATKALLAAAKDCDPKRRPGILLALGARADPAASGVLAGFAAKGDIETRSAAVRALGGIGALDAVPVLESAIKEGPTELRRAAENALLATAQKAVSKNRDAALKIYGFLLGQAPDDSAKVAALTELHKAGDAEILRKLAAALGDDALRPVAIKLLLEVPGNEANAMIVKELKTASDSEKAVLLRGLHARRAPEAAAELLTAAKGEDGAAKAAAIALLGATPDAAHLPVFTAAMASSDGKVRAAGTRAYLLLADSVRAKGDTKAALEMYQRALGVAGLGPEGRHALACIASLDREAALKWVVERAQKGMPQRDIVRAYMLIGDALVAAGKQKEASEVYSRIDAKGLSARDIDRLGAELRRRGVATNFAKEAGFITEWWIIGPFPSPGNSAYGKKFFPEEEVILDKTYEVEGRQLKWKPHRELKSPEGVVELLEIFPRASSVACYAYAEVTSKEALDVILKLGTDDGYELWLNGKRLSGRSAGRALTVDEDQIKARLNAGVNKILLKVLNQGSRWAYCLRITDLQGKPLPLEQKPAIK